MSSTFPLQEMSATHKEGASLMHDTPFPPPQEDLLLTFKEAMGYLRVSRSTLYRLMESRQCTGHKVGSTWRFYREDLRACIQGTAQTRKEVHA